jgi:hypothetical protein
MIIRVSASDHPSPTDYTVATRMMISDGLAGAGLRRGAARTPPGRRAAAAATVLGP